MMAGCATLHPPYGLASDVCRAGGARRIAEYNPPLREWRLLRQSFAASVVRDPGAVERLLDLAVARSDDIGRHGADKRIERVAADRIDDALADPLGIEPLRREALGEHGLVARAGLRPAHMIWPVTRAARDIRVDR